MSSSRWVARSRASVTSLASSRNGSGRCRNVVHDIPLIGNGVPPRARSDASDSGYVNGRPLGSTPPATSFPDTSGGGPVSGTFTITVSVPAAVRSCRNVRSRIDLWVTGNCLPAPRRVSRMS